MNDLLDAGVHYFKGPECIDPVSDELTRRVSSEVVSARKERVDGPRRALRLAEKD